MSDEQNKELVDEIQATSEPTDIAQAFKLYNQANRAAAEEPVASGEVGEPDGVESGEPITSSDGAGEPIGSTVGTEPDDTDGSLGGSTTFVEPIDYSPAKQEVLKNIQNQAIENVRKELKDNGVEMWSITDIREQETDRNGEPTGRVVYRNPDDPNNPFTSRTEAQAFIDSINNEIQNLFRKKVNEEQQNLLNQSWPTLQMMDFANTYQSMNQIEKDIFDDLVAPYAITNDKNAIIGFNVNLGAVANTARQIAKRFNTGNSNQGETQTNGKAKQQTSTQPAMDIKSGNGASLDETEPKTLGEALKRVDEANRKKKEGK